jgi:Fe2+ or Zn2+ uptake regulation protein/Zn-finger protein
MSENLESTAKSYFDQGTAVVPVKQKKPLVEWALWQNRPQTPEEFQALPWNEGADGFAVICGTELDNGLYLGAIDFDVKNVSEEAQENGRKALKHLLATQVEQTPSGGQHWIYHCHNKPRTISSCHDECGLEILGEGKLCIMASSQGYKRLNDNTPTIVHDLESLLCEAMLKAGVKPKERKTDAWFERADLAGKRFTGKTPPCIAALYRGSEEGERNENAIRLASFLANFSQNLPDRVLGTMRKVNRLNDPPLEESELQNIIKSAVNGGYVYGCTDAVLKKHCVRDECPIAPANIAKMLSAEETEKARKLLEENELLDYALTYGKRRLIGEDNAILANFIMFCSGQTRYPISGVISGYSGSGKNESIRAIKLLLPKEWFFEFTTSTPEAIKYLPEEFAGTLVIYEAAGVRGDSGSLSLRAIGEGESIETIYPMRNELTGKMEMGRAKTNAKNFITTSSDIDINPDLYRRVLKHTMNHSTQLTKRVMAKKIRDAAYPDSLKTLLGLQKALSYSEQDFQNALRLLDWHLEAVAFTPTRLLQILDLAVKREQEVALRTHIEKIINFAKVLALLNQKKRLRAKIGSQEYLIVQPEDFLKAFSILQASITETVSRIEKRQEETLKLFEDSTVSLTKHDVASKLRVSTKTATRVLKTLAQAGYLKEDTSNKTYRYELLQKEPNHLDLLENIRCFSRFHRKSLRKWLNTIETTGHARHTTVVFLNPNDGSWSQILQSRNDEDLDKDENLDEDSDPALTPVLPPSPTSTCPDVPMPSTPESSLNLGTEPCSLDNSERSTCPEAKPENRQVSGSKSLDDFKAVYWSEGFYGWHPCAVCGDTKLTSWQAETFRGEALWLCDDCKIQWEKHLERTE